jgi:hypothetical protein
MFTLDVIAAVFESVSRFILHRIWPYTSPVPADRPIPDMHFAIPLFKELHTSAFFSPSQPVPFMYPAALAPVYGLFLPLADRPLELRAVLLLLVLLPAFFLARRLARTGLTSLQSAFFIAASVILSYPLLFELRQGNSELIVCLIVGGGVWCFLRERWQAAAVLFGIAGAMKLFPFVYLGLFLAKRRYSGMLTAVLTAIVVTLASLRYINPSIAFAWHGIGINLAYYQETVALAVRQELGFDHSVFGLIKTLIASAHLPAEATNLKPILRGYMAIAACGGVALFFLCIRHLPVINQVMCLCVASILLPPVSFDYTLLHLYIPWAMLVVFAVQQKHRFTPGLTAVFLCFGVLMSIQTEVILDRRSYSGQIKALALVALMVLALKFPFPTTKNSTPAATAQ